MQSLYDKIKELMTFGHTPEALALVEEGLSVGREDERAGLLYLRGSLYMKTGDWQQAMNSFLQSEALDSNGPATEARQMLSGILDFYNKDLYNP